jgi:hypothetical protein
MHVLCAWVRESEEYELGATFCSDVFTRIQPAAGLTLCLLFYSLQPYFIVITSEGVTTFQATVITTLSEFLQQVQLLLPGASYSLFVSGEPRWRTKEIIRAHCELEWLYLQQSYSATAARSYSLRHCVAYYLAHPAEAPSETLPLREIVKSYHPDTLTWVRALGQYIHNSSGTSVTLLYPPTSELFDRLLALATGKGDDLYLALAEEARLEEQTLRWWKAVRPGYWAKDGPAGGVLLTRSV